MFRRANSLTFLLILALWQPAGAATDETKEIPFEVTQPRAGAEVGVHLLAEGTAGLPAGHHLWVFARRVDFEPLWWPQNEGVVDPQSGEWKVQANIGDPQDVDWQFDIAVAVFDELAHVELLDYRRKSIAAGEFLPIAMPEMAAPPHLLRVKKVRHL